MLREHFETRFSREIHIRGQKKSTDPYKTETVGIWRYPVFYLAPSELGDLEPKKKSFFFRKVYTLGAIALKGRFLYRFTDLS